MSQNQSENLPEVASHVFGWVRTAYKLPGEIGDQTAVLMWSPEWATWLKGMITRWADGTCEWGLYDQDNDKYHVWEHVPQFWMSPILPTASVEQPAPGETP